MQQPKRVTRKGRHVSYAPVEDTGVPIERILLSCCARTRRRRSDSWHRKPMPTVSFRWLAKVERKVKNSMTLYCDISQIVLFVLLVFCFSLVYLTPLSIAEFAGIGRAISPGKAKLVLCARMAHQDGLVGNSGEFRHPERFSRGNQSRMAFFWLLFFAAEKK